MKRQGRRQCQASAELDWVNKFLEQEIFKSSSYLQEQISNAEVAVHAGDHEGGAEVPLHAVHVHLRPQSQLGHDVQVAHARRQDQCCEPIFVG